MTMGTKIIIVDEHVQVWRRTEYKIDENVSTEELVKQLDALGLDAFDRLKHELISSELLTDTEMSTDTFELFYKGDEENKFYSSII